MGRQGKVAGGWGDRGRWGALVAAEQSGSHPAEAALMEVTRGEKGQRAEPPT